MSQKKLKPPLCDDCEDPFTQNHPGILWWLVPEGNRVVKVRLIHHPYMKPLGCCAVEPRDVVGLLDTASFYPTLPRKRVEGILFDYVFDADDEAWLRNVFNVPLTTEFRLQKIEARLEKLERKL